jgi:hypothetical protein
MPDGLTMLFVLEALDHVVSDQSHGRLESEIICVVIFM